MTYTLHFLPEIEEDAVNGYCWYEAKAPGLGEDFLRIFYAYAEEILKHPLLYPKIHGDFRRRILRRFPYSIYFIIAEHSIIIFGLFHCARDPHTIENILYYRNKSGESPHLADNT